MSLAVEADIPDDYDSFALIVITNASTDSSEQFIDHVPSAPAEKKAARRAFDEALGRHLSAIIAEAKRRMANVVAPSDHSMADKTRIGCSTNISDKTRDSAL
jgi:predicted AlkP superfamily pyrophosphatase or phosphodiesterase